MMGSAFKMWTGISGGIAGCIVLSDSWAKRTRFSSYFQISAETSALLSLPQAFHKDDDSLVSKSSNEVVTSTKNPPVRLAIVGAGIGGSSACYFLRNLLGPDAVIDVFEKSKQAGGRLAVIELDGRQIESGGSVIHDENKYMTQFADLCGLKKLKQGGGTVGVYNGETFVVSPKSWSWLFSLSLLWRYGIGSIWRLKSECSFFLRQFGTIYELQAEGYSFRTVPDLLQAMGGEAFVESTNLTAKQAMLKRGIDALLIDELVTAVSRLNYGQNSNDLNSFVGFVSIGGGLLGDLWAVEGGNRQVCARLLEKHATNVFFDRHVTDVVRTAGEGEKIQYFLSCSNAGDSFATEPYDAVIVAVPLEVPKCSIKCQSCPDWPDQSLYGKYQQTVATFVQGSLNYKAFGLKSKEDVPEAILTTEQPATSFSSIGLQKDVHDKAIDPPIFKVFSRQPLTKDQLSNLFLDPNEVKAKAVSWLAYPKYSPPEQFLPFVLDDGVFYVNAIERVASAMEMSAVGARNVAILAHNYIQSQVLGSSLAGKCFF